MTLISNLGPWINWIKEAIDDPDPGKLEDEQLRDFTLSMQSLEWPCKR